MRSVIAVLVVAWTLCSLASTTGAVGPGHPAGVSMTATASALPASSGEQARGTQTEAEQKLLALEERLERQRQEYQALQQTVSILQAKLREAEHARRANPALYGLIIIVVMLLGSIVALLFRLSRLQNQRTWVEEARALTEHLRPGPVSTQRHGPFDATPPLNEATMTSLRELTEPAREGSDRSTQLICDSTVPATFPVADELTAEELIDLEQQADFFIALGQEEAAIALLMGHVRSGVATSPRPYVKLLGIYRQRSEGDAYERIRKRFNRRFNAHAPSWEAYGDQRRTLETYEGVLDRIVTAWKSPAQAVDLLQALLYRRDASTETFELPAYEELLFLHAVARDTLEHMTSPQGVDLLLPIGGEEEPSSIMHYEATRPHESCMQQVDVELDLLPPRKR
jgi:pilus assembly protein FimV